MMGTKLLEGFTSFDPLESFSSSDEEEGFLEGFFFFFLGLRTLRDLPRSSNVKVRKSY